MSISTYAELQTAVASWMKRSDLTSIAPDLIMIGEKWIFRHAKAREMESALSVSVSGTATVPSDFSSLKHARLDTSPSTPLKVRKTDYIMEAFPIRSADRRPQFVGVDGSSFIFGPYPDGAYNMSGIYYAKLTSIASSANALFLANPDLYLFAALAEAAPYMKDDKRVALWTAKRDETLRDVNQETIDSNTGSAMAVSPG